MKYILFILLATSTACTFSLPNKDTVPLTSHKNHKFKNVRTTAYTHNEKDHIKYGRATALGTKLKCGKTCSVATDWSVFPVGTIFKIKGDDTQYIVEDYGAALVGTTTIDIYKPSFYAMNKWGTRHVDIEIIKVGCYKKSLKILRERTRYRHVRKMVSSLQA